MARGARGGTDVKEAKGTNRAGAMARLVGRFEDIAVLLLMSLLMVVVAISTVELGWLLLRDITTPGTMLGLVMALALAFWVVRIARRRMQSDTH
jgi:hypothetical protein